MSPEENASSWRNATAAVPSPVEPVETNQELSDSAEVGNLLESMEALAPVLRGEIVQGNVLKVTESEVLVDVGLKCEAAIPLGEFTKERSEEHTSELQSLAYLVCRLLLEKKKKITRN